VKSVVELLHELMPLTPFLFADRVGLRDINAATGQRTDFENWLRGSVAPGRQFPNLEESYGEYLKSFG
jgi:hypothetical protein